MGKRLFLLLFASLSGVALTPGFLTADNALEVGAPEFYAVETVPLPELEAEVEPEIAPEVEYVGYRAPVAGYAPAPAPQMLNFTVTVYSGGVVEAPSGSDIYRTGQLIYGHNSASLMGGLGSLGEGSVFTVTEGGIARTYQVAKVVVFEKNQANGALQVNGYGNYMGAVTRAAYNEGHYDVALMTCAGEPIPGKPGDATHRLVVFAIEK